MGTGVIVPDHSINADGGVGVSIDCCRTPILDVTIGEVEQAVNGREADKESKRLRTTTTWTNDT